MALPGIDNGYLKFTHFKASKDCLINRFAELSDDGEFTLLNKDATKLAYGGMLRIRSGLCIGSFYILAKMASIATRYSFKRRQFGGESGDDESRVMMYQMQQLKIVPAFSNAIALLFIYDKILGLQD